MEDNKTESAREGSCGEDSTATPCYACDKVLQRSNDEFKDIITQMIYAYFDKSKNKEAEKLAEEIFDYIGRNDYRYLYVSLSYKHMACLELLAEHKIDLGGLKA